MSFSSGASSIAQSVDNLRRILFPFIDVSSKEVIAKSLEQHAFDNKHPLDSLITLVLRCLSTLVELLDEHEEGSSTVPLLSVQNLRLVYTSIEFLWYGGISCSLSRLANFTLPVSAYPNSLLIPKKTMDHIVDYSSPDVSITELLERVACIRQAVCNETLCGLMLQRNLDRILLAYYTLAHAENAPGIKQSGCAEIAARVSAAAAGQLQSLVAGRLGAMIVTKLRGFTKGPPWLRDAALTSLTRILQSEGGLEVVLSGYLEGSLDGTHAAALQAHVAKLVTSAPGGADREQYLSNIARQALQLSLYGLFKNDMTLLRVCVLIISRLCIVAPSIAAKMILQPLFSPLLAVTAQDTMVAVEFATNIVYSKYLHVRAASGVEQAHVRDTAVLADASTVLAAVELLSTVLTICPLSRALVACLAEIGVDVALLHLHARIFKHNSSTSTTRTSIVNPKLSDAVEMSCIVYLQYTGVRALASVERLLFSPIGDASAAVVFAVTREGLVEVRRKQSTLHPQATYPLSISDITQSAGRSLQISAAAHSGSGAGDEVGSVAQSVLQAARTAVQREGKSAAELSLPGSGASQEIVHLYESLPAVVQLLGKLEDRYNKKLAHLKEKSTLTSASSTDTPSSSSVRGSGSKSLPAAVDNSGFEYIASELFLRCLAGFLHLPVSDVGVDDADISVTESLIPDGVGGGRSTAAQCGLVVLLLQEHLPLSALLRDGLQVLKLIQAFIEHYAAQIESGKDPFSNIAAERSDEPAPPTAGPPLVAAVSTAASNSKPAGDVKVEVPARRPLIQVLSSTEGDDEVESAVASSSLIQQRRSVKQEGEKDEKQEQEQEHEEDDRSELIESVLALLAGILGLGLQRRTSEEEALIRSLVAPLQVIAFRTAAAAGAGAGELEEGGGEMSAEDTVAQAAGDVALMILGRSYHLTHPLAPPSPAAAAALAQEESSAPASGEEPFEGVLQRMCSGEYLFSESPAMRGYGTRILFQHVRARSPSSKDKKLSERDAQLALDALLPLLSDQESFVYLNTLALLRELAEHQPQRVFTALLHIFAGSEGSGSTSSSSSSSFWAPGNSSTGTSTSRSTSSTSAYPVLPQARRAMVGEALSLVLGRARRAKQSRPVLHIQVVQMLPGLVQVCLKLAQQRPSDEDSAVVQANVNLLGMRILNPSNGAGDVSASGGGVGDGRVSGCGNETGATERDNPPSSRATSLVVQFPTSAGEVAMQAAVEATLERAALAADRDILRQSAVSLLAGAITTAGGAAYKYLDDVLDVAVGMLQMETGYEQSARAARRAAAFLASHTITTLHSSIRPKDLLGEKGRSFDSLQRVYECLQRTALHDKDEVAKYHASTGLYALQEIYADQFALLSLEGDQHSSLIRKLRIV